MWAFLLLAACAAVHAGDAGRPSLDVDMASYLATTDMVWAWNASGGSALDPLAPVQWWQGAYVGNGLVGAMVTAVANNASTPALRIDVGRTDVWACSNRQPVGYFTLAPVAPATLTAVSMHLHLINATLSIEMMTSDGSAVSLSLLVNAADPVGPTGALLLTALPAAAVKYTWTPDTSGKCANSTVASGVSDGVQWWTQFTASGTYTTALAVTPAKSGGGETVTLVVSNSQRSSDPYGSTDAAVSSVLASVAAGPAAIAAASAGWWSSFWATSFLSFDSGGMPGVTKLEQFTHIAGYRYASAARFTMHDLMGPWGPAHASTCIGPWCQYCWDMNQQVMLYYPTPANRGVLLARPALDMFDASLNGTWGSVYGSNPPGSGTDTLWWLAAMHRYCLSHGDDARLLRSLLPGLRQSLKSAAVSNGTDGLLHVHNCRSPEYPMPPSTDCCYDLSILRWAAQTALALASALQPADPSLPLYADLVKRLAPCPIDPATGSYMIAAGVPFAVPHRHYSHLLSIYDLETSGAPHMAASVDVWWNITCSGPQAHGPDWNGDDECRGFTQAAMAAMSQRLNRTTAAVGNLTSYLTLVGLPNAMYGEEVYADHPDMFSPVSESAYSAAASVYGLLLSSVAWPPVAQAGTIGSGPFPLHLWPGAPFANASFFRLRAEGALLVSAQRVGGVTAWVSVEADLFVDGSGSGLPVSFSLTVPDWTGVTSLSFTSESAGIAVAPTPGLPGTFSLTGLVRGDAVALFPSSSPPSSFGVTVPVGRNAPEFNVWGSTFVYKGELP